MKDRTPISVFCIAFLSIVICGCKTAPQTSLTWPVELEPVQAAPAKPPQPSFVNFPILPKFISDSIASMTLGAHTGTGLIFRASNSVYLVTARHVIFDANNTNNPAYWTLVNTQAIVTTYIRGEGGDMSPRTMTLDLAVLTSIQEVRFPFNHDIALIRFEECSTNDDRIVRTLPGVKFISARADLLPMNPAYKKFEDLIIGSDVVTFGYPTDIGLQDSPQIDRTQPLLRKGIVAGVNNDLRKIVIDSAVYGGFSGGPIFLRETDNMTYCTFYIIGIQTEVIPARLKFATSLVNSGYAMAEPIDIILTGIWK